MSLPAELSPYALEEEYGPAVASAPARLRSRSRSRSRSQERLGGLLGVPLASPVRRRGRGSSRYKGNGQGVEPLDQGSCPAGTYFRRGGFVKATTIPFLGRRIERASFNRRATCANFPTGNEFVAAVKALTDQVPGLSAAEAAALLSPKNGGAWPTGSPETNKSRFRRRTNPGSQYANAALSGVGAAAVSAVIGQAQQAVQAKLAMYQQEGVRAAPRRARAYY